MAFPSVYEMMNLLTTVRKQHFWEYFSGASIPVSTYQGYAGGASSWSSPAGSAGGGGGSSAVGGNASGNNNGGDGASGTSSSITGSAVTRAGGGGGGDWATSGSGGAGGSGGGGHGQSRASGTPNAGTANTGSGGGGGWSNVGATGGSGIVIIRFTTSGNGYGQAGGTVTTSGSDTIISWTATSGTLTFTPTSAFNVEYLVIAGGGGGDQGGGGAGGYRTATGHSVTAQSYTITVGAGGVTATNGSNSIFSSITSTGGGAGGTSGGGSPAADGHDGGSGGGAGGGGDGTLGVAGNPAAATFISWTTTALGTTTGSTGAMDDEVGGGYKITTSANNNDRLELDFNDKRQFSPTASRVLSVWKLGGTNALTNAIAEVGLMSAAYDEFNIQRAVWSMNTAFASNKFFLKASDGGSTSSDHGYVWTTVPLDEYYHVFESVLSSSGFTGSVDGVAQGTVTTKLPTVKMQPHIDRQAKINEVKTMNIKYFEAYNT